jgi:hypothetical protein
VLALTADEKAQERKQGGRGEQKGEGDVPNTTGAVPFSKPCETMASLATSLDASMPMLSAMARTAVGPAPTNSPPMPSAFTIFIMASPAFLYPRCSALGSWLST